MASDNQGEFRTKQDMLWRRPGYLVRRLHQRHAALFAEACEGANITPVQFGLLTILDGASALDQASLGTDVGIDRSTTADVVRRLETRGLVRRDANPADRRMRMVSITAEGRRFVRDQLPGIEAAQAKLMAGLTAEEQRIFLDLARRMLEGPPPGDD